MVSMNASTVKSIRRPCHWRVTLGVPMQARDVARALHLGRRVSALRRRACGVCDEERIGVPIAAVFGWAGSWPVEASQLARVCPMVVSIVGQTLCHVVGRVP